jgi:hypothetical protein
MWENVPGSNKKREEDLQGEIYSLKREIKDLRNDRTVVDTYRFSRIAQKQAEIRRKEEELKRARDVKY